MQVREILKVKGSHVETIDAHSTIAHVARRLTELNIGSLLVVDGHTVLGVISERDIIVAVAQHGAPALLMKANQIAIGELVVCGSEDPIDGIMSVMTERRIRHLPVVDDKKLLGIISIGDIVKHRMVETEYEAQTLRDYLYSGR